MHKNHPIVTTAKLRALAKKNGIRYVDATGRLYGSIHSGVSIFQQLDNVYVQGLGYNTQEKIDANIQQFNTALATLGFALQSMSETADRDLYRVVKANA